ncbi:Zinc-type alcohol dehydrogenase-like protein YogA like [Verticillium longisporum]|uniref:Zinc-type alcohol dehydrogenase-like protein YogA like n=1 Tax=Verticillium longisporum TaxID=100787 RepID=A0A8I2ZCE3_VERLO|nr:Zinc-type alcohol dehydrogenase-like protein YogA like [Verticillium longisporum]
MADRTYNGPAGPLDFPLESPPGLRGDMKHPLPRMRVAEVLLHSSAGRGVYASLVIIGSETLLRKHRDIYLTVPDIATLNIMPHSLTIKKIDGKPGKVYYPLQVNQVDKPTPGPNELLVKLSAAALNHRDLFIRRHLYPGISFENPLLADGYGTVVAAGPGAPTTLLHKPVILTPCRGWATNPDGPEDPSRFSVNGGSVVTPAGMAQDYIVVAADEVEPAPSHLSPAEGAALPVVGLTAWRAFVTKSGNALPGRNILFAVAHGCNVYVTSGDNTKIERAKKLGAAAGVNYKTDGRWEKTLATQLPADRPYLDAVIDGAGGDIVARSVRLLKAGGVISQYGMTVAPKMEWNMQAVLKNIDLKGSTMGSRLEFRDMIAFVGKKKVTPVVSRTVKGLTNIEGIEGLFKDMDEGKQFGKLVIEFGDEASAKL